MFAFHSRPFSDTTNGGGTGGNDPAPAGGSPAPQNTTPTSQPAPTPTSESKPPTSDPQPKVSDQDFNALKKQMDEQNKKLEAYQKKEQEEADKQKSAEQKRVEAEGKLAQVQRENTIAQVRLTNGFTDKIFQSFTPTGETAEEIKASFEAQKASLDEYVKAKGGKPSGQGGGTDSPSVDPKKSTTQNKTNNVSYLEQIGLVKPKTAV